MESELVEYDLGEKENNHSYYKEKENQIGGLRRRSMWEHLLVKRKRKNGEKKEE